MDAPAPPHVTVCICTRDRAATLAGTLGSLAAMAPVAWGWDVLVVDNGSTDDTQAVIASFQDRLPIGSVTEPAPGLANARNRGVACARGAYIAWTDDDVIVGSGWLAAYVAAFAAFPDASLFGGRIVPVLQPPVTPWFPEAVPHIGGPVAARDFGDAPVRLAADDAAVPFGANYAVRTDVQRRFPYDPRRGPGAPYFGEETTAAKQILAAGHEGRWVPECRVEHLIAPERQCVGYIAQWYERLGRTLAWGGEFADHPRMLGVPRWLWRRFLTRALAYEVARRRAPPAVWVTKLTAMAVDRGRIAYFLSDARAAAS